MKEGENKGKEHGGIKGEMKEGKGALGGKERIRLIRRKEKEDEERTREGKEKGMKEGRKER